MTIVRLRALLSIALIIMLHGMLWGTGPLRALRRRPMVFVLGAALVLSIAVHEALHLAGFVWLGGAPWSAVRVKFRGATATAHCAIPLPARSYRAAVALPGLVLGVIPTVAGLLSGVPWLTVYGAVMLGAAAGDVRVLWLLRGVPAGAPVMNPRDRVDSRVGGWVA